MANPFAYSMSLLRDPVLRELLEDSPYYKSICTLEFIKDQHRVTLQEVEAFWVKSGFKDKKNERKRSNEPVDNTVRNHLKRLCDKEFVIVDKTGKIHYYELGPRSESLKSLRISNRDIPDFLRWINAFDTFKGIPFYRDVQDMLEKSKEEYIEELQLDPSELEPIIDFEASQVVYSSKMGVNHIVNITNKVAELLEFFYYKIDFYKETVKFSYYNFNKGRVSVFQDVEPYLLKQHNKRWYVIIRIKDTGKFFSLPLDRIVEVDKQFKGNPFNRDPQFSSKEVFKDTLGIMIEPEKQPMPVTFELKDGTQFKNIEYLISSPMHVSQQVEKVDDIWVRFSYHIIIGPEVTRFIRQWGVQNLRNIQPADLDYSVRHG